MEATSHNCACAMYLYTHTLIVVSKHFMELGDSLKYHFVLSVCTNWSFKFYNLAVRSQWGTIVMFCPIAYLQKP